VRAVQDVGLATTEPHWVAAHPAGRAAGAPGALRISQQVHRRRDGSEFPAAVAHGVLRDAAGRATGRVLGVRDLTDERRVAEQLRQHEKLAALGSLVAGVAHELNNPLTGISAFSQLLLEDALSPDQLESVRLIKREADRAVAVIRDLLLFSRKTEAQVGPVDVNALLQLTVRLRTYTLRAEEIAVELDLAPDAPPVQGDGPRLQQVLLNLIVNAEYAMSGRPERRLALRTRRADDCLVVEVADTGTGIDAETQRHVFEPFFTTKPAGVGTGLGLSVSYGIVQAHGGTITVESAPGHGATFRITLPSASPFAAPLEPA
jgi:signal transduction histidine kinase